MNRNLLAATAAVIMLISCFSIGCSDAEQEEKPSPDISIEAGGESDGAKIDINTPGLNLNIDASEDGVSINGGKGESDSSAEGGIDVKVDGAKN